VSDGEPGLGVRVPWLAGFEARPRAASHLSHRGPPSGARRL